MYNKLEKEISEISYKLQDDYASERDIDKFNSFDHPDRDVIIDIIRKVRILIFPGYFRNKLCHIYTLNNNINMLLEDVLFNLSHQISIVLHYSDEYADKSEEEIEKSSEEFALEFLHTVPKIREFIQTDLQAAFDGDPAAFNKDEIIFSYPGLFAISINRIAHELHKLNIPLIPRIMTEYAHNLTGIDIHPGATLGKYFFIDHGTGIVIGETTIIGDNVKVYQGVTLGALSTRGGQSLRSKKRHPTIENNVTIYSGASILGGETVIGEGSVIGGNCFITASVPAGARVSIKNQELHINYKKDTAKPVTEDFPSEEKEWFYII